MSKAQIIKPDRSLIGVESVLDGAKYADISQTCKELVNSKYSFSNNYSNGLIMQIHQ